MIHEFKAIINAYSQWAPQQKAVLATIVKVKGSAYRKEGTRMLVFENGNTIGAISGGCVEKEVVMQSASIFKNKENFKIVEYDGRYRLGCEGVIYVLLEAFSISKENLELIQQYLNKRIPFRISSYFEIQKNNASGFGSVIQLEANKNIPVSAQPVKITKNSSCYTQQIKPNFRLWIIGAEHDAIPLCNFAANLGWEVIVVASLKHPKTIKDFPLAYQIINEDLHTIALNTIDKQTAIVLMQHNFAKDLMSLIALKNTSPLYLGILGSKSRKERLLNAFIERHLEVKDEFLAQIYGPAGIDLGAETPEEIAISIVTEVLAISRKSNIQHLNNKSPKPASKYLKHSSCR